MEIPQTEAEERSLGDNTTEIQLKCRTKWWYPQTAPIEFKTTWHNERRILHLLHESNIVNITNKHV